MPNVPNNNIVQDNLAMGHDRNDGTTQGGILKGGTATPAALVVVKAAGGVTSIGNIPIEELDDSPTFERAEQATIVHHFRMSWSEALNRIRIYGRGALVTDSGGNFYRVLSSSVQYQKGGKALMTVTSESVSFDVPPDEFSCTPVKLGLDIMKHPRYFYALMPTNQIPNFTGTSDTDAQITAKQAIIRAIQAYRENPFIPTTTNINNMTGLLHDNIVANLSSGRFVVSKNNPNYNPSFKPTDPVDVGTSGGSPPAAAVANGDPNPVTYFYSVNTTTSDPNGKIAFALSAAQELIGKLWRMEDSPMVNGVEVTLSEYYFRPPLLDLGGYIQNPVTGGLPDYFYSTEYPPNGSFTIWDGLSYFNPQSFSITGSYGGGSAISWLRDADTIEYSRTWFRVTKKWLGAPVGAWDADLYTQQNRPSSAGDYRPLILS